MRTFAAIALALLIALGAPGRALPKEGDEWLGTIPVDAEFMLTIRLPKCDEDTKDDDPSCGRTIAVPHVVKGQRISVPRTTDGACPRSVRDEILSEDLPHPGRVRAGGLSERQPVLTCTHFIALGVTTEASEHFDPDRCEVVIDAAALLV